MGKDFEYAEKYSLDRRVQLLEMILDYYEELERYERCKVVKEVLDEYKRINNVIKKQGLPKGYRGTIDDYINERYDKINFKYSIVINDFKKEQK